MALMQDDLPGRRVVAGAGAEETLDVWNGISIRGSGLVETAVVATRMKSSVSFGDYKWSTMGRP